MRLIITVFIALISFSSFAFKPHVNSNCPNGLPPAHLNFCPTFKEVAICHCVASGVPRFLCKHMNTLYNAMVMRYGSVENACASQKNTTTQVCLDSWSCYRKGGKDSENNLCNGTGKACE